jgi:toxin ParE1/3/4
MSTLRWSAQALRDLENIHAYIASDSKVYAERQISHFIEAAERALDFPASGRQTPETDDSSIREMVTGSYRLIYRGEGGDIFILTVVHGRRDTDQIKSSLK